MLPYHLPLIFTEDERVQQAPMRFTPAGCCPCGPQQCLWASNDLTKIEFEITLAGWANQFPCSNCPNVNVTYRLRFQGGCYWLYRNINTRPCSDPVGSPLRDLGAEILADDTGIVLRITTFTGLSTTGPSYEVVLQGTITPPFDLTTISLLNVPRVGSTNMTACVDTGTTVTATAVVV